MKHGKFEIAKGYQPRFSKETEEKQVKPVRKHINKTSDQQEPKKIPAEPEETVVGTQKSQDEKAAGLGDSGFFAKIKSRFGKEKSDNDPAKKNARSNSARNTLDYLRDFVSLLSAVLLILLLLLRIVVVSGSSMKNTLINGDYIILVSSIFQSEYKQGDIVVASKQSFKDGEPIIKRVIATEGQEVSIDFTTGVVSVDGKALDEPYTLTPTNYDEGMQFPLVVDEGCVFVLGDNRNASKDSRNPEIGLIDCREILGRAVFLLLPGVDEVTEKRDFDRFGVIS